jgi:hypothetical protein
MKRGATLLEGAAATGAMLVALAGALAAASPLLEAGYYEGHDGVAHLFRVAILAEDIGRGILYPRWASDLALGYGYPVFHFYGPVSHYLAWLVSRAGPALPEAVKLVYGLALVASTMGAYLLVRAVAPSAGRWGAAVGGAAYGLVPYVVADIYVRGAFGEAVSLAVYPTLLCGTHRLVRRPSAVAWLTTSGSAALAIATYNPLALFGLPLAGVFALWTAGPAGWRGALRAGAGVGIGLGLAAWFWLPALVDQHLVTIGNLGYARENFLAPHQLVQSTVDYRHEQFPFAVGLVQLLVAAAGTVGMVRLAGRERREAAFFPVAGLGLLALISSLASPLWEAVPLLTLIAYPWRLLAFVGLFWAVATGCLVLLIPRAARPAAAAAVVAFVALTSVTETLPEPIPLLAEEVTVAGWQRREQQLGRIGTTTGAEYLPRWSERGPGAAADVPRGSPVPTIESARLEGVAGLDLTLAITTTAPTALRLHSFAFPGWRAWVNGLETPVRPETALGLLTLDLPAGPSRVELRFVETPVVRAGQVVTLAALSLLAVIALWPRRRLAAATGLAVVAVGLVGSLLRPAATAPGGAGYELAPGIWLLGATADLQGDAIATRLYWLATRPPDRDHRVSLTLHGEQGEAVARRDGPARYALEPTSVWRANEIISDPVSLRLPSGRPEGRYTVAVALDDGPPVAVASFTLPAREARVPSQPLAVFGQQIALDTVVLRVDGEPARGMPVAPGARFELETSWRALRVPDDDYILFAHLYGNDGRRWFQSDGRLGGGVSAPTTWQAGDRRLDRRRGVLPLDIPAGEYRLALGWYEPGGGPRLATPFGTTFEAGRLVVVRPVKPPVHRTDATLGGWARLEGWDYDTEHGELRLVWRAVGQPVGRFHVFVHAVDDGGRIVAQSDGPPAAGAFPTAAWPAGAPIEDRHLLPPPRGVIRVGLYDPVSGQRLAGQQGDWIELRP